MKRSTHALWKTEEVPAVPAMISGTRPSSMLSTSGIVGGWGSESSESAPAAEDDAPASSAATTSSIPSRETGDSSSPTNSSLHYMHLEGLTAACLAKEKLANSNLQHVWFI